MPDFAKTRLNSPSQWHRLKVKARELRKEPTPAEALLWERLRRKQLIGFRFRRQHPIGRFVVDFFCAGAKLAVELDGEIHSTTVMEDVARQAEIERLGIRVIRFQNREVLDSYNSCEKT